MDSVKKSMSSIKKLLLLTGVLAVLVLLLVCLISYNKSAQARVALDSAGTQMISINSDDISEFTYVLNNNVYTFKLGDLGWVYTDSPDMTVDQESVDAMVGTVTSLSTDTIVSENLSNAAEYGLDYPEFSIRIMLNDGSSTCLYIGEKNPMVGVNYAYIAGDDRIFAVSTSVVEAFSPGDELVSAADEELVPET